MTRALIVILLAGLVLAASSCGGGDGGSKQLSASEYETQVGDILQPLQQTTLPNIVAIAPTDRERAVTALKNGEARLQNAASELGSMQPPADAVDPTQRLADGISHISDEVTAARKDAEHGDFGKLVQFKLNIASDPAVAEIQAAVRDLINLGYDIAGTGP